MTHDNVSGDRKRVCRRCKERSYAWVFTINNYTDEDVLRLESLNVSRLVVGAEIAPTTGTPHLQGYVRFPAACRFSWWKNQFPHAHVEIRRGSEAEAAEYCKKERVLIDKGHDVEELRERISRDQKARVAIDLMEMGAPMREIRAHDKVFFFWHQRNIQEYKKSLMESPPDPDGEYP